MRTDDLSAACVRLQRCVALLQRPNLPDQERSRATRHLWYLFGYVDALRDQEQRAPIPSPSFPS
jgi:hypothetical protein